MWVVLIEIIYFKNIFLRLFGSLVQRFVLPKTSLLFQKSSNYLYYSNPYFPRINRNIRACSQDNSNKKIKWEKLYDFKTVYNVPDLSPNSLLQIYNTIWTKDDVGWLIYLKMYKFNTLNKINGMYHSTHWPRLK